MSRDLLSASRTDLLLQCPRPFDANVDPDPPDEDDPKEEANYGIEFHGHMANLLDAGGDALLTAQAIPVEMKTHLRETFKELFGWLSGDNQWRIDFIAGGPGLAYEQEVAVGYDIRRRRVTGKAKRGSTLVVRPNADAEHVYPGRGEDEVPGTADLLAEAATAVAIVDHKTGRNVEHDVRKHGQLMLLGTSVRRMPKMKGKDIILAVNHCPRHMSPTVYARKVTVEEFEAFEKRLEQAYSLIDEGFTRTGDQCTYCPTRGSCSTRVSSMIEGATKLAMMAGTPGGLAVSGGRSFKELAPAEQVGVMHQFFATVDKLKEEAKPQMRALLKTLPGQVGVRADGKLVVLQPRTKRNISLKAFTDYYGKAVGEAVLKNLEEMGIVTISEYEEMRAVNDD